MIALATRREVLGAGVAAVGQLLARRDRRAPNDESPIGLFVENHTLEARRVLLTVTDVTGGRNRTVLRNVYRVPSEYALRFDGIGGTTGRRYRIEVRLLGAPAAPHGRFLVDTCTNEAPVTQQDVSLRLDREDDGITLDFVEFTCYSSYRRESGLTYVPAAKYVVENHPGHSDHPKHPTGSDRGG